MTELFGFMQALDEETRVGALMDTIENVIDGVCDGTFSHEEGNRILESAAHKLGFTFDDAYELICYINFRRTGVPPITIH